MKRKEKESTCDHGPILPRRRIEQLAPIIALNVLPIRSIIRPINIQICLYAGRNDLIRAVRSIEPDLDIPRLVYAA